MCSSSAPGNMNPSSTLPLSQSDNRTELNSKIKNVISVVLQLSVLISNNNVQHPIICGTLSVGLKARGGEVGWCQRRDNLLIDTQCCPPPAGEQEEGGGAVKTAVLQLRGDTNPVLWEYCAHLPPSSIPVNTVILAPWHASDGLYWT